MTDFIHLQFKHFRDESLLKAETVKSYPQHLLFVIRLHWRCIYCKNSPPLPPAALSCCFSHLWTGCGAVTIPRCGKWNIRAFTGERKPPICGWSHKAEKSSLRFARAGPELSASGTTFIPGFQSTFIQYLHDASVDPFNPLQPHKDILRPLTPTSADVIKR